MAPPPAAKLSSICRLTASGKAETPRRVTPWLPAKTQTSGRSKLGGALPCQAASQDTRLSRRPSEPAGLVRVASQAATAACASRSGPGMAFNRLRMSSKGPGSGTDIGSVTGSDMAAMISCGRPRTGRRSRIGATILDQLAPPGRDCGRMRETAMDRKTGGGTHGPGRAVLYDLAGCLRFYSRLPVPQLPGEPDPHRSPD